MGSFLDNIYPLLPSHQGKALSSEYNFAKFLAELSVCAHPFVNAQSSSIAIAATLYSFEFFGLPICHDYALQGILGTYSSSVESREVKECGKLLRHIYKLAMPNDTKDDGKWTTP